jgi:alpha-ketoglutarate-dependent 2,4-dichlorophenoxyacetate dioxygenase
MTLSFRKVHPCFVAEASPVDLRVVDDSATLAQIRAAMDEHAVVIFHDQSFSNDEQLAFGQRLDGKVNMTSATAAVLGKSRIPYEGMIDVSNVNPDGKVWGVNDRKRMHRMMNRLWHSDASYQDPCGRYSMLWGKVVPPVSAATEFADMRAAYDALDADMKAKLEPLRVAHSHSYSKEILGFEYPQEAREKFRGAVHPLIRTIPRSNRRSLYLAAHASHIVDWPVPEGRVLLRDLSEHATQREFVYRHEWKVGDLVIWDNRATMHRGRPYEDTKYRRELVRVTTLDYPETAAA